MSMADYYGDASDEFDRPPEQEQEREPRAVIVLPHTDHPPCSMASCRTSYNETSFPKHVIILSVRPQNGTGGLLQAPVEIALCEGCHHALDIASTEAFRAYYSARDDEGKNEGRGIE